MKRLIVISVIVMLGLFVVSTAQSKPDVNPTGSYYTPDDFTTKFWKEKFFGGGPGHPGNVLMAIGQGFVFQNAVLKEANGPVIPPFPRCPANAAFSYVTTYEGGMLTLNPSGPWLKSLKAKNVEAINYSCHDASGNLLGFKLEMSGQFEKSPYFYDVTAFFAVTPDNYEVKVDSYDGVVFQVGYDFDAEITIH